MRLSSPLPKAKEPRERHNQNSSNSSWPPSGQAPWEKSSALDTEALKGVGEGEAADGEGSEPADEVPEAEEPRAETIPRPPRREGKPIGAPDHSRLAPKRVG